MEILQSGINGCFFIKPKKMADARGYFIKTYAHSTFRSMNIPFNAQEEYYSVSNQHVFRGFHFQIPPHDHDKIVFCPQGRVLDLIVDLRKSSATYKKLISIELNQENPLLVFIPKGCAHGFYTYEDNSLMVYMVSTEYAPEHDRGISYTSFNVPFPVQFEKLIISERDRSFPLLEAFDNPF